MPSKKDLAKKILQDVLDGKPIGEALLERFRKMQGKAKTNPLPPSRAVKNPGRLKNLPSRAQMAGKPVIPPPGGSALASKAAKGGKYWDKIRAGLSTGKGKLALGLGGLGAVLLGMGVKGAVKGRIERQKQAKAIKGLPPATIEAVLRDRRRQQMLATKRGLLARNDPEAFQILMMGLSGETPQELAQGEILLGRPPQASPQAAQTVESLLAAMG